MKGKPKRRNTLNSVLTATLFAVLSGCFVWQVWDQVHKFLAAETVEVVEWVRPGAMELPPLVICPLDIFKWDVMKAEGLLLNMFTEDHGAFSVNASEPFPDLREAWEKSTFALSRDINITWALHSERGLIKLSRASLKLMRSDEGETDEANGVQVLLRDLPTMYRGNCYFLRVVGDVPFNTETLLMAKIYFAEAKRRQPMGLFILETGAGEWIWAGAAAKKWQGPVPYLPMQLDNFYDITIGQGLDIFLGFCS